MPPIRADDMTPSSGTKTMIPCPRMVEIPERRGKFRMYLHALFDIAKIACLIATAHLLLRLTVYVPMIVDEIKKQTALVQDLHDDFAHYVGNRR